MKCPKCKREIDNNSVFCEYCGYKIKKLKWALMLLIIVVFGGIILLLVIRINNRMSAKAEEQRVFEHCSTISDYRYYVNTYPNGEYVALANNKIRQYEHDSIKTQKEKDVNEMTAFNNCINASACRYYLRQYPTGKYLKSVINKLDEFVSDSIIADDKLFYYSIQYNLDIDRIRSFIQEYSRATIKNDYETIEKLYANKVRRYQYLYNTDRYSVLKCYKEKEYEYLIGVYGKHSNIRWNTLEVEFVNNEIDVRYIEDYFIDRYDQSKYSQLAFEKHIILNKNYEIVYDVQLEIK